MRSEQHRENSCKKPFWIALALLSLAIIFGLASYPQHPLRLSDLPQHGAGYDYFFYHSTTNALNEKISNIYSSPEMLAYSDKLSGERHWAISDNHLLPFYMLYQSLAKYPFENGYYIHLWININLFLLASFALCLAILPTRRQAYTVGAILLGCSLTIGPAVDNIWLGQISLGFTAILAFLFLLDRADYSTPAGICLALAILIKMYPALLLVYFAIKKRFKLLKSTVITLLVLGVLAGLQWGFGHYANYWNFLSNQVSYNVNIANQSLIVALSLACPHLDPDSLKAIHFVLLTFGTVGLGYMSWIQPHHQKNLALGLLEYSIWLTVAMVLSPISWTHHHVLLICPLLAFLGLLVSENISTSSAENNNPWNSTLKSSKRTKMLALFGIVAIVALWCLEGETATNQTIKYYHYIACANHLGTWGLLVISSLQIVCLYSGKRDEELN